MKDGRQTIEQKRKVKMVFIMTDLLLNLFKEMEDGDLICIWNEFCYSCNMYGDEIFTADTLEEMIDNSSESGLYWVNRFFYGSDEYSENGSANPNRNYFQFNGYGNIVSFDYIYNSYSGEFNHIDIDELIDYIIENKEDFGYSEISDILESEEE